jgi:hypothetical protein
MSGGRVTGDAWIRKPLFIVHVTSYKVCYISDSGHPRAIFGGLKKSAYTTFVSIFVIGTHGYLIDAMSHARDQNFNVQ